MQDKTGQPIPITTARDVGVDFGYSQVIITAFDKVTGKTHVTTWGDSLEDCEQAAQGGNFVKKALGWPEALCSAVPVRVGNTKKVQQSGD
jgi:hypothetical protein